MVDYTNFTRVGQKNGEGDYDALFRDKLIPELITQFDEKRVVKKYVRSKTIENAKSASFPILGTTAAKYVTVGDSLLGNQKINHSEITINVDPFLIWDTLLSEFELKLQAYDDRAEIAAEGGRALANTEDKQLLQVGVLAARADAVIEGGNGGSVLDYTSDIETDSDALISALTDAAVALDEKNVPEEDRAVFLRPLQYRSLAMNPNVIRSYIGGGSFELGTTGKIGGLSFVKTNHLPSTLIEQSSDTSKPNNIYYGDFTNTVALVMHKGAVGTVSVQGLTCEAKWMLEYLAHLMTARILQGHGILRPECAVEITKAAD